MRKKISIDFDAENIDLWRFSTFGYGYNTAVNTNLEYHRKLHKPQQQLGKAENCGHCLRHVISNIIPFLQKKYGAMRTSRHALISA